VPEKDDLSRELAADLRSGGIHALYQPLIDVATGRFVAVEALSRWNRTRGPDMSPEVFIPVVESTGVVHALGRFMLDECLGAAERWRAAGHHLDVSVNVSPRQLSTRTFFADLAEKMTERVSPPPALTIEITESLPLHDFDQLVPRLEELRLLNVGISLDDFGSGHTSIALMRRLPLTEIKLDRSLIQSGSADALRTLRSAADRARELGLRVVAEGIETHAHLELARDLGCDRAQGFLFSAPMRLAEVDAVLARSL
jgi:EAL domain-containing protein (putative c-di-GMP-specific phosphodiesterase class I)